MLREAVNDNKSMITNLHKAHRIEENSSDIGTASMLKSFIDGAEKRNWFLFEASKADQTGHCHQNGRPAGLEVG